MSWHCRLRCPPVQRDEIRVITLFGNVESGNVHRVQVILRRSGLLLQEKGIIDEGSPR
jgi:hypothetical protein